MDGKKGRTVSERTPRPEKNSEGQYRFSAEERGAGARVSSAHVHELAHAILDRLVSVGGMFNRLLIVSGAGHTGKTEVLKAVGEAIGVRPKNVNLLLSQQLVEIPERQWARRADGLVRDVVEEGGEDVVLLDNTELLFDVALRLDPLRLLLDLSRGRTVIASWNGPSTDSELRYAHEGHAEYRRYRIRDFMVVSTDDGGHG